MLLRYIRILWSSISDEVNLAQIKTEIRNDFQQFISFNLYITRDIVFSFQQNVETVLHRNAEQVL